VLPEELRDPHEVEIRIARSRLPKRILKELEATRGSLDQRLDALTLAVEEENVPVTAAVTGGLKANLMRRLERFERRLIAGAKKQHADVMVEIGTARGSLYPFGKHQERAINFVPLLARYGLALRDDMRTEADRHAAQLVGADAVSETSPEAVAVRGQS